MGIQPFNGERKICPMPKKCQRSLVESARNSPSHSFRAASYRGQQDRLTSLLMEREESVRRKAAGTDIVGGNQEGRARLPDSNFGPRGVVDSYIEVVAR